MVTQYWDMTDRYRDPVHGFISVSREENRIIDTAPFQRLRHIKQLALTNMVFHGAEHTRFGHSLGTMHLVTRAFRYAVRNGGHDLSEEKQVWYEQILRLMALLHDIGHAPFSHASEDVFPNGMLHEDYSEKIITKTCIADIIGDIGQRLRKCLGDNYTVDAKMVCDIYRGRIPGEKAEFTFLKSFMDSELDCDKMDYLLRDSLYCGVNYGRFDLERLLQSLVIYKDHTDQSEIPRLAIQDGGIQAFEAFMLARYFMFTQVYFHRVRRFFDYLLPQALQVILPNKSYPTDVQEYLRWNDDSVWYGLREKAQQGNEVCKQILERSIYPCIYQTKVHPEEGDIRVFRIARKFLKNEIGQDNFIEDDSATKMPHGIPRRTEVSDEKAVVIVSPREHRITTISSESRIIQALTDKINICRIYVKPEWRKRAEEIIKNINDTSA